MYGAPLIEMAQVAEQEHMQRALMARERAIERRERRRQFGHGRAGRAWKAFWAPRDVVVVFRRVGDSPATDLTPCADC